ncbi:MAG: acetoin utilization protein AcuC [Thaumarchaeota archaeon]|nr:acetoin utilization protein AcuC [Nitrososphaerota archaeon]
MCKIGIAFGEESNLYSFPGGHPLNNSRTKLFEEALLKLAGENSEQISIVKPVRASEKDLLLFHEQRYVDFVKQKSKEGTGFLDYGDTPSFPGVYEASLYTVGSSQFGLDQIVQGKVDHFFNPVGGLHHARRERAGGFCVFDDCAVVISRAIDEMGMKRVAYVDIDAHHGDGVYYGFKSDERVIIGDIHEDGAYLYPGTGFAYETGEGKGKGSKLNIPLGPGCGDAAFIEAFDRIETFIAGFNPEFIFLQCGADGLKSDPLTHLEYSSKAHAYATSRLHKLSHEICGGRMLAMGGGGYNPQNVRDAWIAVVEGMK